jgi:hypothetical protein
MKKKILKIALLAVLIWGGLIALVAMNAAAERKALKETVKDLTVFCHDHTTGSKKQFKNCLDRLVVGYSACKKSNPGSLTCGKAAMDAYAADR